MDVVTGSNFAVPTEKTTSSAGDVADVISQETGPSTRPNTSNTKALTVRVSPELVALVDEIVSIRNLVEKPEIRVTRSDIVRCALESYVEGATEELQRILRGHINE